VKSGKRGTPQCGLADRVPKTHTWSENCK